jgi:phenylalanyl-tRNA synthetase beta chain
MKIAYSHLIECIEESPSIEEISDRLFQLGHEHEIDGNIFDMEFTPNRGDCLSLNGLLRDLAVFYSVNLSKEIYSKELDELYIDFENLSQDICPQISFLKLEVDNIPEEYTGPLNNYFVDLDLNKNNFYTDVSNYLSYETGQPTHCYDSKKINGKLIFHELDKEQKFETLLDKNINLSGKNSVFSLDNEVINLAGVIGGMNTSCSDKTKTVIVECAFFKPEAIIGKSVKYDIQSEASHKFERYVDRECQEKVLRRFIKIVSEHTNIKNMSYVSYKYQNNRINKIPINFNKINQIIGIDLEHKNYIDYLSKLGFDIEGNFIKVPSYRNDVKNNNDLAEEVARVIGYNNIQTSEIKIPKNNNKNFRDIENKLRYFLLDHGFYEVVNPPFVAANTKGSIKVDNPLDSNREYLRTNITESLLENLLFNERRQKDSVKLFEISDIYSFNKKLNNKRKISIIASGRVGLNYEDFSKKINKNYFIQMFEEILPNPKLDLHLISRDSLDTKIKNEIISMEVNINSFSDDILDYKEIVAPPREFNLYSQISDLPCSFKDISYSIKNYTKVKDLETLLLNYQSDIIKDVYIFDYFNNKKNHEVKIGFRFIFQSTVKTLTSAEIDAVYSNIVKKSLNISGVTIPGIDLGL